MAALVLVELLALSHAPALRLTGIVLFAVPAALAGYFAARGLTVAMIEDGIAAQLLSLASAGLVGGAAAIRCLTLGGSGARGAVVPSSDR